MGYRFGTLLVVFVVVHVGACKRDNVAPTPQEMREPLDIGGHKEFSVSLTAPASDALVDRLNSSLRNLVHWDSLQNSEGLGFAIWDKKITGWAKVQGDDWDLAIYLTALKELSADFPEHKFEIALEPDGQTLSLLNGEFRSGGKEARAFLGAMATPRPDVSEMLESFELVGTGEKQGLQQFEAALKDSSSRFRSGTLPELEYSWSSDGNLIVKGALNGSRTQAAFLAAQLTRAWFSLADAQSLRAQVSFKGKRTLKRSCAGFEDWIELEQHLRTATGPQDTENVPVDNEDSAPRGARKLGSFPEAQSYLGGRSLEWTTWEREVVRLEPDGVLHVLSEGKPILEGADRQLFRADEGDGDARVELVGPDASRVRFPQVGRLTRYWGFVNGGVFATNAEIHALGNLKHELLLFGDGGEVKKGATFVNVEHVVVRGGGQQAYVLAEIDGSQQLVVVELPSLKWTAKKNLWKPSMRAKRLVSPDSATLLAVLERDQPGKTSFVRVVDLSGDKPRKVAKDIPGGLSYVAGIDDKHLWLVIGRWNSPQHPGQYTQDLARIRLADGSVEFLSESIARKADARLAAANTPSGWFVAFRWLGIYRLNGDGDWQQVYQCEADREDVAFAVSTNNNVAVLSNSEQTEGVPTELHLIGPKQRTSLDVGIGGSGLGWNDAPSLQQK